MQVQKNVLFKLLFEMVKVSMLVGDVIIVCLIIVLGNGVFIGGLKVMMENGWFVVWLLGIEDVYKIYCESFLGVEYCEKIEQEVVDIVSVVLVGKQLLQVRNSVNWCYFVNIYISKKMVIFVVVNVLL